MRSVGVLSPFRLLSLLPILLAAPALAAWPHDPNDNLPLSRALNSQTGAASAPDGAAGAFIAFRDQRTDAGDVYLQHVTAAGAIAPGWPADGLPVCTAAGLQSEIVVIGDGTGGAYVAWGDLRSGTEDLYAIRMLGSGTRAPGWPVDGVLASSLSGSIGKNDTQPAIAPDGSGGMYLAWTLQFGGGDDDIYLARLNSSGSSASGFPVAVDNAGGYQHVPRIVVDGAGSAQVVYEDETGTGYDIHYRRVSGAGAITANSFVTLSGDQLQPFAVTDGLGGVLVAFTNYSTSPLIVSAARLNGSGSLTWGPIQALNNGSFNSLALGIVTDGSRGAYIAGVYVPIFPIVVLTHVASSGFVLGGWPAGGIVLGSDVSPQLAMAADLHGGVLTVVRAGGSLRLNRLDSNGNPPRGWPVPTAHVNPSYVLTAEQPTICDDGSGGAILAWSDFRDGVAYDLYAQRVEKFAQLGNPEPAIAGVKDVANDQGGKVRVSWAASHLDADPVFGVSSYRIWRQVPATLALRAIESGRARLAGDDGFAMTDGAPTLLLRATSLAAQTIYWENIGTQPAAGLAGYSFVASTTGDSVGAGNPRTLFMVEALGSGGEFWDSSPDSGFSVDNLPPAAPTPFTGAFLVSQTRLSWGRNSESDLAGYRLYRGTSPGFVPSSATLISAQPDTGYIASPGSWYYKVTAIDVHGNESPASLVSPTGTVAVSPAAPAVLAFGLLSANPSRGPVSFRLALPLEARVSTRLFDAGGRLVRTLAEGALPAGEHTLAWDGRDERGDVAPAGIYFVRTVADGRAFGARFARLR